MSIILDHTIVTSHDEEASARFFADIFVLTYGGPARHLAPVKADDTLTLDFDNRDGFESHHYAFHVGDQEFDDIFGRIKDRGITYGSGPRELDDMQINTWRGAGVFIFLT